MTRGNLGEISELRADRSLLNPHFDHYLLADRSCELRKIALPTGGEHLSFIYPNNHLIFCCDLAHVTSPSSTQFGFQHATLYSKAERLVLDLFNSSHNEDNLYTFLDNGTLIRLVYKPTVCFNFSIWCLSFNDDYF